MEIPYTVTARRDTGLFNSKVGIWLFLASEVMLFGGLFSAYVFLRAGVRDGIDPPWPMGVDVHGKFVWLGFLNTLVLILSIVLVVLAWAQLKMRNWRKYQLYMGAVLACSAAFMVVKSIEYNAKLNHHFGVSLTDGTLVDGALVDDPKYHCPGDVIVFEATSADFALDRTGIGRKIDPYFSKFAQLAEGESFAVKVGGEVVTTEGGLRKALGAIREEKEIEYRQKKGEQFQQEASGASPTRDPEVDWASYAMKNLYIREGSLAPVNLEFEKPIQFWLRRKDYLGLNDKAGDGADEISLFRGNKLKGTVLDANIDLEVHSVDMRMVRDESKSKAWSYLGEGYYEGYREYQDEVIEEHKHFIEKGYSVPLNKLQRWYHPAAAGDHHGDKAEHGGEKEDAHGDHGHGGHGYPVIHIADSDSRFSASHGPKFGPYYAIYFTMTGLHGLHVIGGAIVLGYFLFFGKKLYDRNPEHLANRVEVGGLFWHFVDLVWIFLFPIMYLF